MGLRLVAIGVGLCLLPALPAAQDTGGAGVAGDEAPVAAELSAEITPEPPPSEALLQSSTQAPTPAESAPSTEEPPAAPGGGEAAITEAPPLVEQSAEAAAEPEQGTARESAAADDDGAEPPGDQSRPGEVVAEPPVEAREDSVVQLEAALAIENAAVENAAVENAAIEDAAGSGSGWEGEKSGETRGLLTELGADETGWSSQNRVDQLSNEQIGLEEKAAPLTEEQAEISPSSNNGYENGSNGSASAAASTSLDGSLDGSADGSVTGSIQPVEEPVARAAEVNEDKYFPTSPVIERQKAFWIIIFSETTSKEGLIHDGLLTQPVFERVNLEGLSWRRQKRYIRGRKRKIAAELRKLATDLEKGREPAGEGARLLALYPEGIGAKELRRRAGEVRFQRGLADRFQKGLITSGAIIARIKDILAEHNVPRDIAYLPHVESSFNIRAYSKFGAAGIWQFTRGTGKKFMTIKYEVDERLDPLVASRAAGRFLSRNHERLGSWPLAITGYNYGPVGIKRIVKKMKTDDLGYLIENYHGRLFKFASKNFYAEFLAAREVATHYQKYFGYLELEPVLKFHTIEIPFYLDFTVAANLIGIGETGLHRLNPSLRTPVVVGTKYIPKGFKLRLPEKMEPENFLSAIPEGERHKKQKLTEVVRVQRGDTLYAMGLRYNVPWEVIARANHITAYHRIRPGQRIVIPRRKTSSGKWVARAVLKPKPKVARRVTAKAPARRPKSPPLTARVAPPKGSIAMQPAEGASLFQDLELKDYKPKEQTGRIIAAYGETLGHYADWAAVSTRTIRRYNGIRPGAILRPNQIVVIPLSETTLEQFSQYRFEFHQSREEDLYSTYAVLEVSKVKVHRGETIWFIAQSNNVPMWLFYQHNPKLISSPIHAGMSVSLPVIRELAELEETRILDSYETTP